MNYQRLSKRSLSLVLFLLVLSLAVLSASETVRAQSRIAIVVTSSQRLNDDDLSGIAGSLEARISRASDILQPQRDRTVEASYLNRRGSESDQDIAISLGESYDFEFVLLARVSRFSSGAWEISAKVFDVKEKRQIAVESTTAPSILQLIEERLGGLADELAFRATVAARERRESEERAAEAQRRAEERRLQSQRASNLDSCLTRVSNKYSDMILTGSTFYILPALFTTTSENNAREDCRRRYGLNGRALEQYAFVRFTHERIILDLARGHGEYVDTFIDLLGCDDEVKARVAPLLHQEFQHILTEADADQYPHHLYFNIKSTLLKDDGLVLGCRGIA